MYWLVSDSLTFNLLPGTVIIRVTEKLLSLGLHAAKEDWAKRWADLVYNINFKDGARDPATGNPLPVMGHGRKYEDYLIADLLNEPDAMQHEGWAVSTGRYIMSKLYSIPSHDPHTGSVTKCLLPVG